MDPTKQFGIALTGGIACGKSTVAREIADLGYLVIDADQLARQVVEPGTEGHHKLVTLFGQDILDQNGTINRRKVRHIVFCDAAARKTIENIIHPLIHQKTQQLLEDHNLFSSPKLWFYEAALIFEKERQNDFFEVWVAYCEKPTQIARLMKRDGCSLHEAEKIIDSQMPTDEKAKRAHLIINTDQSLEFIRKFIKDQIKSRQRTMS